MAHQEGVAASLLFLWQKLERQGTLTAVSAGEAVVPASALAAARAEIAKLERILGKKTLENESSAKLWCTPQKKVDCALALAARGRAMKTLCRVLGTARSHIHELQHRHEDWRDNRKTRVAPRRSCAVAC